PRVVARHRGGRPGPSRAARRPPGPRRLADARRRARPARGRPPRGGGPFGGRGARGGPGGGPRDPRLRAALGRLLPGPRPGPGGPRLGLVPAHPAPRGPERLAPPRGAPGTARARRSRRRLPGPVAGPRPGPRRGGLGRIAAAAVSACPPAPRP